MEKTLELICEALSNKKGVLIKVLNVKDLTSIADYFIISSVMNKKQAQASADEVEEKLEKAGIKAIRKEGYREGEWILMDFGDVIVHIFTGEERQHYDFDSLWKDALSEDYSQNKNDNGQQTSEIKEGDIVKVFLYHDPRHRLTASMRLPKLEIGEVGYTEVILTTRFGAFVDVGTERGIFLPYSEMIEPVQKGQKIWIKLYEDKTGRLAVTTHVEEDIRCLARPCKELNVGDKITGTVYNITRQGIFIITRERWIGFLHNSNINTVIKLGQELIGRITFIREDGHVNISLRQTKEREMNHDMAVLIDCMNQHNGLLPYTDKSDSKLIKLNLRMSKSAFKRAVGHLLKTNQIIMSEGKIQLKR